MKFSLADPSDGHIIHAYDKGVVTIGEQQFRSNLILLPEQIIPDWRPAGFDDLEGGDFSRLEELAPDLVLLGSGEIQRFPDPALYRNLIRAGIGMEVMTTPAACRTYNILVSEGRRVAAALIVV